MLEQAILTQEVHGVYLKIDNAELCAGWEQTAMHESITLTQFSRGFEPRPLT